MIRVKSVDAKLITTDFYDELIRAVQEELEEASGFNPQAKFLSDTSAIVYSDDIPEEPLEAWETRACCECAEYDWGRGCPYRDGHITLMMPACKHFSVEVKE